MRVLIVKTSSMGDVVHALPVASDIARAFPHARIDWVVEEAFADIPRLHPAVTHVIPIALRRWRRRLLARDSWREFAEARRHLRRTLYHAVIDCQGLLKSALVARTARGPVTGFSASGAREPLAALFYRQRVEVPRALHAVDRCRRVAAAALDYAPEGEARFGLDGRVERLHAAAPFDRAGAVVLYTNASRPSKLWPDADWIGLEAALAARGLHTVLAWGSAAERSACERRAAAMKAATLLPRADLASLAALSARAALVVGLDTGLTHLAAAVGAPTVGIFCDYDPALVGLRGTHVANVGGVDHVPSLAAVLAAVDRVGAAPGEPA